LFSQMPRFCLSMENLEIGLFVLYFSLNDSLFEALIIKFLSQRTF